MVLRVWGGCWGGGVGGVVCVWGGGGVGCVWGGGFGGGGGGEMIDRVDALQGGVHRDGAEIANIATLLPALAEPRFDVASVRAAGSPTAAQARRAQPSDLAKQSRPTVYRFSTSSTRLGG